eukprot:gb/GEZN01016196.1/.p1 GENE.gb/GEZN01016196.1/~~gb/GEZN01016196.1/.p1  ORF type:complete len:202 (-),score=11.93 gb/GEZN01016196.1/:227-832(-)
MAQAPVSYTEASTLPCRFCGQPFRSDDVIIPYSGRGFHKRCFSCNKCRKAFPTPEDPQGAVRELPYCGTCFQTANTQLCGGCGEDLGPRFLKPSGTSKRYHEGCFRCETCGEALLSGYKNIKGRVVCGWQCAKPKQVEAKAPETFCTACGAAAVLNSPTCPQCGEEQAKPKPQPKQAAESCPGCGQERKGAKFCTGCGHKF